MITITKRSNVHAVQMLQKSYDDRDNLEMLRFSVFDATRVL